MIRHYLKLAIKFIVRDRFHSFLNIFGLSLGITISIITFLFVQNELDYNSSFEKANRIYIYGVQMTIGERTSTQRSTSIAAGPVLKRNIPGIESFLRYSPAGENLVKANEKFLLEDKFFFADSSMFHVFTNKFYSGIPENCLSEQNTVVLTKSTAIKYFGRIDPIGEIIEFGNYGGFKVTAVVEDTPDNSEIQYDALLSFTTLYKDPDINQPSDVSAMGSGMNYRLYLLFEKNFSESDFYEAYQIFHDQKIKGTGVGAEKLKFVPVIDNLKTYYLNSKIYPEFSKQNRQVLTSFIYIGIFILLLACINYINMATSRAGMRAKEIGIKKVMGGQRSQIAIQLLGESFITTLIAFILAFGLTEYILGFTGFNDLIGKQLIMNIFHNQLLVIGSMILLLSITFISGIYPAIYLSGLKPIKVLKENKLFGSSKSVLRNALIVIQFSISIMVITLAFLMNSQLNFVISKDLGFKKDNVILIDVKDEVLKTHIANLKNELTSYSGIKAVSFSYSAPAKNITGYAFGWENNEGVMETHAFRQVIIDKDFYPTLGIQIVQGQNFYRDTELRDRNVDMIVNEALVKFMGWEDPIGKRCSYGQVVGVVKDFNYSSLYNEIRPMYSLKITPPITPEILIILMNEQNVAQTIDYIESKWHEFAPNYPFNFTFLDAEIAQFYKQDQEQKKMSNIFSLLCILISCLGLFGLTSYVTLKRKKEVAIRKTYGAGIRQIISTLFKNILFLIVLSSIIAAPISYMIYTKWIQHFAFQVPLNYLSFIWTSLAAIVLAFLISLYHYLKVINTNIIESLRYE